MSLHAPFLPWKVVCGLAARLGEAGREGQGRGPGMGLLPSARMSLWQIVSPFEDSLLIQPWVGSGGAREGTTHSVCL